MIPELSSGGLLLSAVRDIRDRYIRLLHGLAELRRHPDPGARTLLDVASAEVAQGLTEFETVVQTTLEQRAFEDSPNSPDLWSEDYLLSWPDVARNGFSNLAGLQRRLVQYLPIPSSPPADIGFFLARGVDLSPTRPSHRERFALSHSMFSLWESQDFGTDVSVPAVPVPYSETLTPLRWPLLLHELGHFVLPATDADRRDGNDTVSVVIHRELGDDVSAGQRRAFEEVLADRVAEQHCGVAYLLALLREFQLVSMAKHAHDPEVAPATLSRLRLLGAWPDIEPHIPVPWIRALERDGPAADLTWARDVAMSLVPNRPSLMARPEVVSQAIDLLKLGQPASAVRLIGEPSDGFLVAETDLGGLNDGDIDDLFLHGVDQACNDAEILQAAWALESGRSAEEHLEELERTFLDGGSISAASVKEYRLTLARKDTAISRSLQAAAVHSWLVLEDSAIGRRLTPARIARSQETREKLATSSLGDAASPGGVVEQSPLNDLQLLARLARPSSARNRLVVRPLVDPAQIGGTTVDLRLGTEWEVLRTSRFQALNPADDLDDVTSLLDASVEQFRLTSGQNQGLVLHPGELILALTLEYLSLPPDLWGNLEGRSTWARLGLQVHASAGMVDAGFDGYLTLELQNTSRLPLVLYPGLRVAQMAFFPVSGISRYYRRKSGAAYADQTSARTAFTSQHEHEALRDYLRRERANSQLDKAARSSGADDKH